MCQEFQRGKVRPARSWFVPVLPLLAGAPGKGSGPQDQDGFRGNTQDVDNTLGKYHPQSPRQQRLVVPEDARPISPVSPRTGVHLSLTQS